MNKLLVKVWSVAGRQIDDAVGSARVESKCDLRDIGLAPVHAELSGREKRSDFETECRTARSNRSHRKVESVAEELVRHQDGIASARLRCVV